MSRAMIADVAFRLRARSAALLQTMEGSTERMVQLWLLLVGLAGALRIATSPLEGALAPETVVALLLLAAAPIVSGAIAMRWFSNVATPARTTSPLWKSLSAAEARRHPLYGAGGLMVSLLAGLLLNILLRGMEYLTAMPALSGEVPAWLSALQMALTADVVLLTSLYAVAFVAALRRAPIFPAMLMAIWATDIGMQIVIREVVAAQADVPAGVGGALATMLGGNINKVLISVLLWLPYLLMSKRVNLTYRHRLPR